ncbi:anthrone oxygenase family protein [Streptomyces sp. NPDC051219]|uniref:anthrone oxygenase family protein n=1 Tax=Streptomyces sp. NPDC051219 TaxID=3155283 RepID=UPI00341F6B2F
MDNGLLFTLPLLSALGTGLVAGTFYAFSSAVMRALAALPAPQGIAAMQSINIAVIPWFVLAFLGAGVLSVATAVVALMHWDEAGAGWALAGGVVYFFGSLVLTFAFHIPRNNALADMDPAAEQSAAYWTDYVREWTAGNHVRTVASLAAAVCFILALTAGR